MTAGVHAQFDDLQGHLAADGLPLLGHVDDGHAAFSDLLQHLIATDFAAFGLDGMGAAHENVSGILGEPVQEHALWTESLGGCVGQFNPAGSACWVFRSHPKTSFACDWLQRPWTCVVGEKGSRRTSVRLRAFAASALTTAFSLNLVTKQASG